jgi:uncharacterized protein YjbI with pentapeptide repeats
MIKKNRWTLRLIFGIAFLLANQHAFADSPGLTPTSEETIDHILETRQCVAGCSISQADLAGVDLQNASLTGAYIIYSQIINANLDGADLSLSKIHRVDLSGASLHEANFEDSVLSVVVLDASIMTDAFLHGVKADAVSIERSNLAGIDFRDADLKSIVFTGTNLVGADFSGSKLNEISFLDVDLKGSRFENTSFENIVYGPGTQFPENFSIPQENFYLIAPYSSVVGLHFSGINLADMEIPGLHLDDSVVFGDLSRSNLSRSVFRNVNFLLSRFVYSNLKETCFYYSDLACTDLSYAELNNSTLKSTSLLSANLTHANLQGANLQGSDLRRATIDNTNFQGSIYNSQTQFPENFDPIAAGAILSEESLDDCPAPSTN